MRLFTAIDIPAEITDSLDRLITGLRPAARINWARATNLHVTTKFIGEWPEERLEEVKAALAGIANREPLPIDIRGLGFFPNAHSPRVFWAAVRAPAGLAQLARETDQALSRLGIPAESRPFSPHLTLARIKERVPLEPLRRAIAELPSTDFGSFNADRFALYRSELRPGGSIYTRLSEYPLEGTEGG